MVEKSLGFKVVKYVQSEGGSAREEVASFAEKWEADEFAKGQSIRRKSQGLEGVRYEVEETAKPKLLAVSPLPKTISEPHQTLGQKPKKKRLTPAQQKRFVQQAGKCSACGITDITILDVHHIRPYAKGGSNRPWNLSVLCPTCHRKAQNGLLTPLALIARPSKGARSQAAAIQEPSQPKTESVQRDANQPSIHLELKPGFMEQGGQISETVVYLEASNRGTVPVFIPSLPSLQILMPDGRHWIPREDWETNKDFPFELRPGRGFSIWRDMGGFVASLKKNGYSGKLKLRVICKDEAGRVFTGNEILFDADDWAKA